MFLIMGALNTNDIDSDCKYYHMNLRLHNIVSE